MFMKQYASRVSALMGRDLRKNEWGRLGRMLKTHGSFVFDETLKFYEKGLLGDGRISTLGELQVNLTKYDRGDAQFSKEEQQAAVKETESLQKEGQKTLEDLMKIW